MPISIYDEFEKWKKQKQQEDLYNFMKDVYEYKNQIPPGTPMEIPIFLEGDQKNEPLEVFNKRSNKYA